MGSSYDEQIAQFRFDVDRVDRDVAGVRGRVDAINARLTEIQRLVTTEVAGIRSSLVSYQKTMSETHSNVVDSIQLVRDATDKMYEVLEQVRVTQEQQGRMLREIYALREDVAALKLKPEN